MLNIRNSRTKQENPIRGVKIKSSVREIVKTNIYIYIYVANGSTDKIANL